jgi:hypothetical protein
MYRRHLAGLAAAAIAALISTTAIVAELPAGGSQPSPTDNVPKAVLVAMEVPSTPAPATEANPVVQAQRARNYYKSTAKLHATEQYLEEVYTIRKAQAYTAAMNELSQAQAAVHNAMFTCIRNAESNDRYGLVSGAYGILISTWQRFSDVWSPLGSWSVPGEAPPAVQDLVAYHLYEVGGGYGGWHDYCTGR